MRKGIIIGGIIAVGVLATACGTASAGSAAPASSPAEASSAAPYTPPRPTPQSTTAKPTPAAPTTTSKPTPTLTPEQTAGNKFITALNAKDTAGALAMTEPGSSAYLYAESEHLLNTDSRYGAVLYSDLRKGPTMGAFALAPSGLIVDFTRNDLPISKMIAAGDGETFTETPGEYDDWTGQATASIHSFRLLDGDLQILVINKNDSTGEAGLSFTEYAAGGKSYDGSCCGDVLPGTSGTEVSEITGAPGGGTAYGTFFVDGSGSRGFDITVPPLG